MSNGRRSGAIAAARPAAYPGVWSQLVFFAFCLVPSACGGGVRKSSWHWLVPSVTGYVVGAVAAAEGGNFARR